MPPPAPIPRFLLPNQSSLWRPLSTHLNPALSRSQSLRHASSKAQAASKKPSKPIVLEKPAKFNPPSHPARLRREAPRYPGPQLGAEEEARMKTKQYPNMMPAEGTFMFWFLNNRLLHMWIALGTLISLALTVFLTNFRRNSPFADLLPPYTQFLFHPFRFTRTFLEVLKMTMDHDRVQTVEKRRAKVEDVQKRHEYRKAHGLDKDESFGSWTAKTDAEMLGPGFRLGDGSEEVVKKDGEGGEEGVVKETRRPVKKWLGIW